MPQTDLEILNASLGGSPLARAAIRGDSAVSAWYPAVPSEADAWRERASAASGRVAGDWLRALEPAVQASGAAAEKLDRVVREGGALVTTGQQPGLFGGPAYTWVKAVTAIALAAELEEAIGMPVAPLFWAATDDTDFEEASETWISGSDGAAHLALPPSLAPGLMLSQTPLPDETAGLRKRLGSECGSCVDSDILRLLNETWVPGANIGDAYVQLLRHLLEPLGMAVLDEAHPAARDAIDPVVRRALQMAAQVDERLARRCSEIEQAGFSLQVAPVPGLSLVFEDSEHGKSRVPISQAEARARLAGRGTLGPNVLLRPVVEQAVMPTVAYVAGPGELAYFAQATAVADAIGEPAPLALPRHSLTIVEPRVRRALDRRGLRVEDFADPHGPERRLAREAVPEEVTAEIRKLRESVAAASENLVRHASSGTASGIPKPDVFRGAARQLEHKVERLERRVAAAAARADSERQRDIAMLRGALTPGGKPQERALNLVPLFARYGRGLLSVMQESARSHVRTVLGIGAGREPRKPSIASSRG